MMKINVQENLDIRQEVLALGLFDDDKDFYGKYNKELAEELEEAGENKALEREFGKVYSTRITNSSYKRILVISLGDKKELNIDKVRRVMNRIVSYLKSSKLHSLTTNILSQVAELNMFKLSDIGRASAEGLILSEYSFDKYKSKKDDDKEYSAVLQIGTGKKPEFDQGMYQGMVIADATNYAKDLVNEPAIVVTPEYLEKEARKLKHPKIRVDVMEKKDMQQKGLNALLAVSSGSDKSPKLIFIEYAGGNPKDKWSAIVGKGITFDSGGYNLKPTGSLEDMKCDMSGGAAVLGTIKACSELGVKKNILGVIPSCENLINGSAIKPGDIVKAYNGKTIEIGNTDAEGRLILADAISYTEKNYGPDKIIDLATLTGACVVALGYYASGILSNDDALSKALIEAGNESYDRVWLLPFFEEYQDNMDGDISDLKNVSTKSKDRAGGAITAAVFLSKFIDKASWAHIDIAGPAFLSEPREYNQKYASGCGVRLLTYYFMK